jgi:predicted RNA-binding Zn-ribbon protein involved in translation (DUF1610 family)
MSTKSLPGLLARRLREEGMASGAAVSVAELHRRLLPYALCRSEMGYATKAEYDVAFLELLRDDRCTDVEEEALLEAVSEELASPEPGLALLQRFAASEIHLHAGEEAQEELSLDGLRTKPEDFALEPAGDDDEYPRVENGDGEIAPDTLPPIAAHELDVSPADLMPGLDDHLLVPRPAESASPRSSEDGAARCRACGAGLPARRGLRFCPHCGENQLSWPCEGCGEVVERGWRYCPMCGKLQPDT